MKREARVLQHIGSATQIYKKLPDNRNKGLDE